MHDVTERVLARVERHTEGGRSTSVLLRPITKTVTPLLRVARNVAAAMFCCVADVTRSMEQVREGVVVGR